MKKGFTLAELLGVIVLLAAIALITIPLVSNVIKNGKQDLYNNQIDNIKGALELWMSNNQKPAFGETVTLSLSQLKEAGLIDIDIKNPIDGKLFPNDIILRICRIRKRFL